MVIPYLGENNVGQSHLQLFGLRKRIITYAWKRKEKRVVAREYHSETRLSL